jgi:hypothetical protein
VVNATPVINRRADPSIEVNLVAVLAGSMMARFVAYVKAD